MAKMLASEYCNEVVSDSFRIHGGYGYSKEYEIERLYREAAFMLIGEGTSDIQKMIIGRSLLKEYKRSGSWRSPMSAPRCPGADDPAALPAHRAAEERLDVPPVGRRGQPRGAEGARVRLPVRPRRRACSTPPSRWRATRRHWGLTPRGGRRHVRGDAGARPRLRPDRRDQPRDLRRRVARRRSRRSATQLADFEVHLVVTVRNIGGCSPRSGRRRVKNGHPESFAAFAERQLTTLPAPGDQVMAGLLARARTWPGCWTGGARYVPPERTHVVVSPAGGAEPDGAVAPVRRGRSSFPADAIDVSTVAGQQRVAGHAADRVAPRRWSTALDGRLEQPWYSAGRQALVRPVDAQPGPLPQAGHAGAGRRAAGRGRPHVDRAGRDRRLPGPRRPGRAAARRTRSRARRTPTTCRAEDELAGLPDVLAAMLLRVRDDRQQIAELRAANQAAGGPGRRADPAARPAARWWRR